MSEDASQQRGRDTAARLLGSPLDLPLGVAEPASGVDFRALATAHTFGDSWTRTALDDRSRSLVSVAIAATLGTHEPCADSSASRCAQASLRIRSWTCSSISRRTRVRPAH